MERGSGAIGLTWLAYVVLAWFAYLQAAPGLVIAHLRDELGMSYSTGGLHVAAFAAGALIAGVVSARLERVLGRRRLFWSAAVLMNAGAIGLTAGRVARVTVGSVLVMGLGAGDVRRRRDAARDDPGAALAERSSSCAAARPGARSSPRRICAMRLDRAQAIVDHVVADATGPVSVFVADTHGELVAAATMDGAAPDTRLNAQRKAYTAARSDARSTRELAEKARADAAERASFDPFFTFFLGGVAVFEDGRRVGAVGVSGLPGEVDERLALQAIERTA